MRPLFILVLVGLTSASAYLVGTKGLGMSRNGLRMAVRKMLECVGGTLVFFIANLVVGAIIILAVRVSTRKFMSLYFLDDLGLAALSFLQGLTFQWWREPQSPRS